MLKTSKTNGSCTKQPRLKSSITHREDPRDREKQEPMNPEGTTKFRRSVALFSQMATDTVDMCGTANLMSRMMASPRNGDELMFKKAIVRCVWSEWGEGGEKEGGSWYLLVVCWWFVWFIGYVGCDSKTFASERETVGIAR